MHEELEAYGFLPVPHIDEAAQQMLEENLDRLGGGVEEEERRVSKISWVHSGKVWCRVLKSGASSVKDQSSVVPLPTLPDMCLPLALRELGVPVTCGGPGPFFALKDGNAMLARFGLHLERTTAEPLPHGKFVMWQPPCGLDGTTPSAQGHFTAVINDGSLTAYPSGADPYLVIRDPAHVFYCLRSVGDQTEPSDGSTAPLLNSIDALGGVGGADDDEVSFSQLLADELDDAHETKRLDITVPHTAPVTDAQLSAGDPLQVSVLADGRCFYYAVVAARNAREWIATHDHHGNARSEDRSIGDREDADELKASIATMLREAGQAAQADELDRPGKEGYPSMDCFQYVSKLLGGQVVLQTGDLQVVYGTGPVVAHFWHGITMDGAGHQSDHFELIQSWLPVHTAVASTAASASAASGLARPVGAVTSGATAEPAHDGAAAPPPEPSQEKPGEEEEAIVSDDDARPQSLDKVLARRRTIRGAETSTADFEDFFSSLKGTRATLHRVVADPVVTDNTVVTVCSERLKSIQQAFPGWPLEVQHAALGVLCLYRCRVYDLSIAEHVTLAHVALACGDPLIRAHEGILFFWCARYRFWARYEGLLPQNVVQFLKNYFLVVEGLFRSFEGNVARKDAAILAAINASYLSHDSNHNAALTAWQDLSLFSTTAERRRKGGGKGSRVLRARPSQGALRDDDEGCEEEDAEMPAVQPDPSEPWQLFVAKTVAGISKRLEFGLQGKTLMQYYSEWCSIPRPPLRGVGYIDVAFEYNEKGESSLTRLPLHRRKDLYYCIKHSLIRHGLPDPVLEAASARVEKFQRQTFWANVRGLRVCLAALALAKRGHNVDQVFFFVGPGGVGLSLTTAHLNSMLGLDNHKYFDPQAHPK